MTSNKIWNICHYLSIKPKIKVFNGTVFTRVFIYVRSDAGRSHSFWLGLVNVEAGQIPVLHKAPDCELRSPSDPTALSQYITYLHVCIRRKILLRQAVFGYIEKRNEVYYNMLVQSGGYSILRGTVVNRTYRTD